jgi:hypothetical protein
MSRYAILRDRQLAMYKQRLVSEEACCKKGKGKKCSCAVASANGAKQGVPAVQDVDADGFCAFRAPLADEAPSRRAAQEANARMDAANAAEQQQQQQQAVTAVATGRGRGRSTTSSSEDRSGSSCTRGASRCARAARPPSR